MGFAFCFCPAASFVHISGEKPADAVLSMDEVMEVSRQVIAFCTARGIDRRRAFYAGLCMEELAGNVVRHGFAADAKSHSADIRVIHMEDGLILRIRDNCMGFDPTEYARAMDPGDVGKNVGIQLAYRVAREISYQNLLGMNVLTIRI